MPTVTINSSQATYINPGQPTQNYNLVGKVAVAESCIALIAFSLSSIPAGSKIISARLRGTVVDAAGPTVNAVINRLAAPFTASTVTYNTKPGWTSGYGSFSIASTLTEQSADITKLVKEFYENQYPSYGLALTASGSGNAKVFSKTFRVDIEYSVNKYLFQDGEEIKKYGVAKQTTWNPNDKSVNLDLYDNNLTVESKGSWGTARATNGVQSGKWYWEVTLGDIRQVPVIGVANSSFSLNDYLREGHSTANANIGGNDYDTVSVLLDLDDPNGKLQFWQNGVLQSHRIITNLRTTVGSDLVYPAISLTDSYNDILRKSTANFGQTPFKYDVPDGYQPYDGFGWVHVGTAPVTKEMFDTHGMTDLSLITNEAIQGLGSESPELLCWTDEEKSITLGANLIPVMTSDTSPSGTASASSTYNYTGSTSAYKAFNGNNGDAWASSTSDNDKWLEYDFDSLKTVAAYGISPPDSSDVSSAPASWTFEGWNGSSWEILDTRSGVNGWAAKTKKEFSVSMPKAFSKYRLHISATGGATYVQVSELEILEGGSIIYPSRTANLTAIPHPQLLLPIGDIEVGEVESVKVQYSAPDIVNKDINVVPLMSSDNQNGYVLTSSTLYSSGGAFSPYRMFDGEYGPTNATCWLLNTPTGWFQLQLPEAKTIKSYAVCAHGNNTASHTNGVAKNWTLLGSNDGSSWTTVDTVVNQTGWSFGEKREFEVDNPGSYRFYKFNMTANNGHATWGGGIAELFLYSSYNGNGAIKVLVSGDSGSNWKGKSPANLANVIEVKTNGFTQAEFNALTKEELAALFPNGKARFAFYLEQEKSTDTVEVQSLSINEMQYTMTPSLESASVTYEMLKAEQPKVFVSRNDGTDWTEIEPDKLINLSSLPAGNQLRVKFELASGQEIHAYSYSWV